MNYDIKSYVHGVPKGQKLWGAGDADSLYLKNFYRQFSSPALMLVEVKKFDKDVYTYYTYCRSGNITANDGRAGSYFAITLRINHYYQDIKNIYNLLDAAYNKFIVGTILKVSSGAYQYMISDFSQKDDVLKNLGEEISHYLMQFSSDSDFISLNGFAVNGQADAEQICLHEADSKVVSDYVKKHSNISVSPFYASKREQQLLKEKNAEIEKAKSDAQNQITIARQEADKKVQQAYKEKDEGIESIRSEYKEADKTIADLNSKLKKSESDKQQLNSTIRDLNKKLKEESDYRTKYQQAKDESERNEKALSDIRSKLSGFGDILKKLNIETATPVQKDKKPTNQPKNPDKPFMALLKKLRLVDFLILLLLFIIIVFHFFPKGGTIVNSDAHLNELTNEIYKKLSLLDKYIHDISLNSSTSSRFQDQTDDPYSDEILSKYNDLRINVIEFKKPNQKLNLSNSCTVEIKANKDKTLDKSLLVGEFQSEDFTIEGKKITPKKTGDLEISYVVKGKKVISRTIKVTD